LRLLCGIFCNTITYSADPVLIYKSKWRYFYAKLQIWLFAYPQEISPIRSSRKLSGYTQFRNDGSDWALAFSFDIITDPPLHSIKREKPSP
jgi:hypothetical protein